METGDYKRDTHRQLLGICKLLFVQETMIDRDHLVGGTVCSELATVDQEDAVTELCYGLDAVRNVQDRLAGSSETPDSFKALLLKGAISHRENFINQQNIRIDFRCYGERQAHVHARRVLLHGS